MAASTSQEPPSLLLSRRKYQVFLSFRGPDTRKTFISHLYVAVVQAGIHTFRDDDEIPRGENIELELKRAIRQSKIAIVVFSEDYASSRWCLDELVMIMKQKGTAGWKVVPVFYHVDPSNVRKQTGSFARLFVKHGKRPLEQVDGWRLALEEAGYSAGMVLGEGHEAEFVKSIVKEVTKELNLTKFHVPYFIGKDSLLEDINSWLQSGSFGGEIAMLYGIGGVGKTTISKIVCNENSDKFDSISFLGNIGQKSKQSNGLLSLQRQLLCDVLYKNEREIHDEDEGIMKIKDAICCKKVLLVLDGVDDKDQFNALIRMQQWLYPGSKIIITTRNKGLFAVHEECVKFKVEPLNEEESIELFSWHAFGQAHPIDEFVELSKGLVHHCEGLPLALGAIGSSLSSTRIKEVWESALQELEKIPNCKVQRVLRISYDCLHDEYQKDLFLDIACFFIGMDVDCLVQILNGLGVGGKWRIDNLTNRCLVEIDNSNRVWIHQIIRDMGREIAREQSPKCQRIWDNEEAFTMLEEKQDAEMVHGLTLDMHALMEYSKRKDHNFLKGHHLSGFISSRWLLSFLSEKQVQIGQKSLFPILNTTAFKKMQKIKFLQLNYVKFNGSYEQFPKSLIWLRWHGFYLRSIPKQFSLEKLVVLDMQSSSLVNAWEGKMHFPRLKILDLSCSHGLIRTPDFSHASNLESLILEDCIRLVEIYPSIGDLHGLLILHLGGCKSLEVLPEEISKLDSLKKLVLDGCSNLNGLNIKLEQQLRRRWSLHRDGIVSIMPHMTAMPLKLFSQLSFSQRKKNMRFSTLPLPLFLVNLDLSGTPIRCLPESVKDLTALRVLYLARCRMLRKVPELPTSLQMLTLNNCHSLEEVADILSCNWAMFMMCELLRLQECIKQDLIQRVGIRMFMIINSIMRQIQNVPSSLETTVASHVIDVLLRDHGGNLSSSIRGKDWLPAPDWPGITFKYSITPAKQGYKFLCFVLYTRLSITRPAVRLNALRVMIINHTKRQKKDCCPMFPSICGSYDFKLSINALWTSCWIGDDDLVFDDGDKVSVWMWSTDPAIQIEMVAREILYTADEGNDNTESNDDENVIKKAQIASPIFRYFDCYFRGIQPTGDEKGTKLCYSFFRKDRMCSKSEKEKVLASMMKTESINYKELFLNRSPNLPADMRAHIETKGVDTSNVKFLIVKTLCNTDLSEHHGHFAMPLNRLH